MFIQPFAVAQKETIVRVGKTMLNPILNTTKSVDSIPLAQGHHFVMVGTYGHR